MEVLRFVGPRRIAGLVLGAVVTGVLAMAAVFVGYQPGYEATGRVSIAQAVGTGASQFELAPYSAAVITSLADSGLTATDLGGGQVEAVASGSSEEAALDELRAAFAAALGSLAATDVRQNAIAVDATRQVLASLAADRDEIREAAGVTDLPAEYRARTVDILDLRNRVAEGGSSQLRTLLSEKEAELAVLDDLLSDYEALQKQIDLVSQSYANASQDLALSQARESTVTAEPEIASQSSGAVPTTLTAVRAGLAAAALFVGFGLLSILLRTRGASSAAAHEPQEPSRRRRLGRPTEAVARHGSRSTARL